MTRSAAEVRSEFLEFFKQRGHAIVPGSPVVPYDDPTLLFTNAGMNQFKDVFLGAGTRSYTRAADTQPCIRAGGKHNDLDDVGQDTYHHTFFEMLGNWSFGDYFKKEAIEWAWELLTGVWGLDKTRLHATYFGGDEAEGLEPDTDAKELWATVTDIDPAHIHPGGKKDNFWEMGATGPCGPCSEIHIDLTPDKSGASLVNASDARVIEIWNLVFIQFNRDAAGKLTPLPAKHVDTGMGFERVCALLQGKSSNYDTDVFTPIFQAIQDITGAPPYCGTLPTDLGVPASRSGGPASDSGGPASDSGGPASDSGGPASDSGGPASDSGGPASNSGGPASDSGGPASDSGGPASGRSQYVPGQDRPEAGPPDQQVMIDVSYRVIADHARCLTFALNDGAVPDREGRGYVLRRILRRAVRYAWQYLDMHEPFLYKLVPAVVDSLGDAFPQLKGSGRRLAGRDDLASSPAVGPQRVAEIIREEEESFDRTLDRGIALFEEAAEFAIKRHHAEIRGEDAFKLHDTYGFPIDLTEIMAAEKGLRIDFGEYERLMELARERARAPGRTADDAIAELEPELAAFLIATDDEPKYKRNTLDAMLRQVIRFEVGGKPMLFHHSGGLPAGSPGVLIFDQTCFYAEQGGQEGDRGVITNQYGGRFDVRDTVRLGDAVLHYGDVVKGDFVIGRPCGLRVDTSRRATMQNHTATHVMNWALREVLGDHVQQKGSLVDPEKTRFDFSHLKPLSPEEIERVEQLVNEKIAQKLTVYDEEVAQADALSISGMRAVFGEKYPDPVRVLSIGKRVSDLIENPDNPEWRKYPIELCGGTHCENTAEIERFAIVSEEAVAKGVRRVVGITGRAAKLACDRGTELLKKADTLRSIDRPEAGPPKDIEAGPPEDIAAGPPEDVEAGPPEDVAAGPRTGRTDRLETGPTAKVAARASRGRDDRLETGPTKDLATQVAELQQTVAESTLRVVDRLRLREALADLQKLVKQRQKQQAAAAKDVIADMVAELLKDAPKIGETTVVVAELPDLPLDQLKTGADMIKQKCKSAAMLFAVHAGATEHGSAGATKRPSDKGTGQSEPEAQARGTAHRAVAHRSEPAARATGQGKALLLAAMSKDLIKKGIKAGDLIKHVAPIVDGRGGGPPTMAQAGGKSPEKIPEALAAGREWIEEKLG